MKFSEMSYTRPDIDALLGQCKALAAKAAGAASGEELVNVYYEQSRAFADYNTAAQLASIHYNIYSFCTDIICNLLCNCF